MARKAKRRIARFAALVPTKTPEVQNHLMPHRTRYTVIRQQTAVINSIRAHIVAPVARKRGTELLHIVTDPKEGARGCPRVPCRARHGICSYWHVASSSLPLPGHSSYPGNRPAGTGGGPGHVCHRRDRWSA
jgi:hypothetical protein